jgi:hypothetical protein
VAYVLEDAGATGPMQDDASRGDRQWVDHNQLPGLHLTLVCRVDEVQGAHLRRRSGGSQAPPSGIRAGRRRQIWVNKGTHD